MAGDTISDSRATSPGIRRSGGFTGTLPTDVTRIMLPVDFSALTVRADKFILQANAFRRSFTTSASAAKILPEILFSVPFNTTADDLIAHDLIAFLSAGSANARGRPANPPSGLAENALNLANGNPIDLRHLGNRHAVFCPGADAGELRPWNLTCRQRGCDRSFGLIVTCERRKSYSQHSRLARRLVGWRGMWN